MNLKIRDSLFFVMAVSLVFNNIPKSLQMNFLGGPIGNQLVFYPVIIGFIYTAYYQYKYQDLLVNFNKFKRFVVFYLGVILISLIVGLYSYPYYDLIINGPINQIEKLPIVLNFLQGYGIIVNSKVAIGLWMVARVIKGLFFEVLYTFGLSYIIYCWYKGNFKKAISILGKGLFVSVIILVIYSSIEIFYLAGNTFATNILKIINPYIHIIKFNGTWWPPLLWSNQLRSVFAEPSYFGIYCAFALPLIWFMIIKTKLNDKYIYVYVFMASVMTFLLVLTKARTGFVLHIGELVVLFLLLIYVRNKMLLKKGLIILLCSVVAFVCGNLFIANYMTVNKNVNTQLTTVNKNVNTQLTTVISNYIDSNAKSLANPDARSNRARYSVMEADIKVGLEHPLFGVGSGLRNAYVINAFSKTALENKEIQMWLDFSKRLGILKSGIPKLGEYTSRFSETGVVGLLICFFPAIYLIVSMLSKLKRISEDLQVVYITFLTSFVGMLASGIGDSINITYCYWVLLGLGYAMCFGWQEEKVDNE